MEVGVLDMSKTNADDIKNNAGDTLKNNASYTIVRQGMTRDPFGDSAFDKLNCVLSLRSMKTSSFSIVGVYQVCHAHDHPTIPPVIFQSA